MARGLDEGLMTDLWNFPSAFGASPVAARARLRKKLERLASGPVRLGHVLARLRHGITYRNIRVLAYHADLMLPESEGLRWLELGRFRDAAVSELARKIARAVTLGADSR